MSNILKETDAEISSFSGSSITSFDIGKPVYNKYFDTAGKWERWSGSGAPYVIIKDPIDTKGISQLVGTSIDKITYTYVDGNVSIIKYWSDTGSTLMFTLTYAYSGSYVSSITRS